jgi:ElaB/YqjD/DUF883 family membrane-anchored ribosome-binding protein
MSGSRTALANAAHQAMLQRSQLRRSLGLAHSELQPTALAERGKYHVKSTAQDVSHFAQREITANRAILGLAALGGITWLLRDPIREQGPAALKRSGKAVQSFIASINRALDPDPHDEDYIDPPEPEAKTAAGRWKTTQAASLLAAQKIQEQLEDKMKPFGQTARDTRDKASELAERTAENARQTAEAAKARVQEGYGRARAATSELAAKGREQADVAKHAAENAYAKGKEKASVATSRAREFASDQPLTLLAGALAAGLLVGSLVSKKDEIK